MRLRNSAPEDQSVHKVAVAFKESRRLWFRDLLVQLGVTNPEFFATQLALLVDGSIAQDLVRNDPAMARAAKEAATVLLKSAGVEVGGSPARLTSPGVRSNRRDADAAAMSSIHPFVFEFRSSL